MIPSEQILQDTKQALKDHNSFITGLLRQLTSAFKNEEIALKKKEAGLLEVEQIAVLRREVKKRKDAIEQYIKGGRPELAENEQQELALIESYLPMQMTEEQVRVVVKKIIIAMGEVSANQFGQVMGKVVAELKGQADGGLISKIVKEELS